MYVIFIKESIVSSVTFCRHMYGCELWNLMESDVDKFYVV